MTVGETTRSRCVLLGGLYFAQGVPWGFVTVALALRLASLGVGPAAIGELVALATLPWTLKPLLGPLVDRAWFGRFGRRRPILLAAEAGMAASLLALAAIDPRAQMAAFATVVILHNVCGAAQDVTADALAIALLPETERGRANGVMSAGKWAGTLVGGPVLAQLGSTVGWGTACLAAALLMLAPAGLVLAAREPTEAPRPTRVLRETFRSFGLRVTSVAAVFALLVGASSSLLYPLTFPLYRVRLGFSEEAVNLLVSVGGIATIAGTLVGGAFSDRLGRRRAIAASAVALASVRFLFAASAPVWAQFPVLVAFTVTGGLADGMLYAALLAFFMDVTNPRVAATHFQVYMALVNVKIAWASFIGGRLGAALPGPAAFLLGGAAELLPLLLLPLLDPEQAARAFPRTRARDAGPGSDRGQR